MKCKTCGSKNEQGEISCARCGRMLPLENSGEANDPLIGTTYGALPEDNFMGMYAARGRRFLLVFGMLAVIMLGLGALPYLMTPVGGGAPAIEPELLRMASLGVGVFALVFVAYLIGKTGESVGAPFAVNFLLALIPPFWPAVLARIGGRPLYLPYLYLALTLGFYGGVMWFARDMPYIGGSLLFLLMPLMIYQLLGCSVCQTGPALGYGPALSFMWLCVAPVVLLVMMLNSVGYGWLEIADLIDFNNLAATVGGLTGSINLKSLLSFSSMSICIVMFLLVTHVMWIRSVYQNLCYPQLE